MAKVFFGFEFDKLSLADEVKEDVVRDALKRGEQAIEHGSVSKRRNARLLRPFIGHRIHGSKY
ncbi:hypothetical protein BN2476_560109 [Paraburkholderia piptadeniae]|uniref:Uncharacterized protein n=1 Tax=Paraburkholderia piptadeniae TaxID=1701573 RepID=A0A1N7SIU0_9BURK|nr:hypothetical protein BN2476_560109 [Paraburkholderia piptadeniae]